MPLDIGPVQSFCAELQRFRRAAGRDLPGLARELRISRTQLYAILGGEIKRPPDWTGVVRPLLLACGGTEEELADWRRRHAVMVGEYDESRRAPARPAQLPADLPAFSGRAEQLADLDRVDARVLLITGSAGVGKTALAVHWAHRVAGRFPDGQLYVNLRGFDPAGPMSPAEAVRGFLDALGVAPERLPAGVEAQSALFRSLVRRTLVVLDNAADADHVRSLLPAAPDALTIITSRRRLTALVADRGAHPVPVDLPTRDEAIEMLARRLGRERIEAEPAAVESIVEACARLPLALALVAARAAQTGFPLAAVTFDDTTVQAAFDWSYNTLKAPEARLFRLLGRHPGPDIALAAAAALAGRTQTETRRSLAELTEAGLLLEPVPGRYAFHDLLRSYAAGLPDDESRAAVVRLLDHYTHTAHAADRVLNPARDPIPMALAGPADGTDPKPPLDFAAAVEWLTAEHAVLLGALRQAADEGLDSYAWQLGWVLDTFLVDGRYWQDEGAAWAAALRAAAALADHDAEALAHRFLAIVDSRLDRFGEAHAHIERAVELCDDPAAEGQSLFALSYVCWLEDRPAEALEHTQRSLRIFETLGDRHWIAKSLIATGWYRGLLGDAAGAIPLIERAVSEFHELGDTENVIVTLAQLGLTQLQAGDRRGAIRQFESGLRLTRTVGNPVMEGEFLMHLGDATEDAAFWHEAYEVLSAAGHPDAAVVARKIASAG